VGANPLPQGSTTINATIRKYDGEHSFVFGLITQSRKNLQWSGGKSH